ncbi:MAG: AI-2E family transporter [Butyricicoccus sp.]
MEDPNQEKKSRFDLQPHYIEWGLIVGVIVALRVFSCSATMTVLIKKFSDLSPFIRLCDGVPAHPRSTCCTAPAAERRVNSKTTRLAKGLCSALTLASVPVVGVAVDGAAAAGHEYHLAGRSMDLYTTRYPANGVALHNNPDIDSFRACMISSAQIMNWAQNDLLPQLGNMMSGVVTTVNVLMNLLIGVIIALYILNSKDTFCAQAKKMTYSLFAVEKANAIMARVAHIHRVFGGFITGKLMDSSIIGMLCFIGMRLMISFGWMTMPTSYALLIAVIIGVTNIIPFFGPFIGAIPSTILIMVISPVQALYFVIFVLLLQQFDGNILGPKILGNATGLSSFWVMFAILLFGGVMGFAGMVVGVPLFAVLYSMLTEKINHLLKKRGLSVDTNDYRGHKRIDPETHAFVEAQETMPPVSAKERRRAAQQKNQENKNQ